MKKLFKAIRHNDLEEVKAIIEKKPELVSCISTPPPKKDQGQSPLQVAIKADAFEIAYYLIGKGADVNFMESEECGNKWRMPLLHDCIMGIFISMCYGMKNTGISDRHIELLKTLLEHGADFKAWADGNYLPHANEFGTNRSQFLEDFKPVPDRFESFVIKGRKVERTVKGDIDKAARTRACIQGYCERRGLKV